MDHTKAQLSWDRRAWHVTCQPMYLMPDRLMRAVNSDQAKYRLYLPKGTSGHEPDDERPDAIVVRSRFQDSSNFVA